MPAEPIPALDKAMYQQSHDAVVEELTALENFAQVMASTIEGSLNQARWTIRAHRIRCAIILLTASEE